jgi:cytoskeletal protein CcmA (bactofilin family)
MLMLFSRKKGLSIETLIGQHTVIAGDLTFSGGLRLDGRVRGNVIAEHGKSSMLVVSETAVVEGEIRVGHLILNGTVNGPVHAQELLELQPKARIDGEVHYAALEMHQGAVVQGRLVPLTEPEVRLIEHAPAPVAPTPAAVGTVQPVSHAVRTVEPAAPASPKSSSVRSEEEPTLFVATSEKTA